MVFEAINAKLMNESDVWRLNGDGQPWKSQYKSYELTGAYGCYLSHIAILKMMLEKYPGKDLVLFEDDAFFKPTDFVQILNTSLNNLPTNFGMYYIGGTLWSKPVAMDKWSYKLNIRMGNTHSM